MIENLIGLDPCFVGQHNHASSPQNVCSDARGQLSVTYASEQTLFKVKFHQFSKFRACFNRLQERFAVQCCPVMSQQKQRASNALLQYKSIESYWRIFPGNIPGNSRPQIPEILQWKLYWRISGIPRLRNSPNCPGDHSWVALNRPVLYVVHLTVASAMTLLDNNARQTVLEV